MYPCQSHLRPLLCCGALVLCATQMATVLCAADCNQNGAEDSEEIQGGQVSDCNGNGLPDECEIMRSLSFGTQRSVSFDSPARATCAIHFDDDNVADLAVLYAGHVEIFYGGLGSALRVPTQVIADTIVHGDFDGDGRDDLLLGSPGRRPFGILLNRFRSGDAGRDPFRLEMVDPPDRMRRFAVTDLNSDGRSEVVIALADQRSLSVLNRDGGADGADGAEWRSEPIPTRHFPHRVAAGDLDLDGDDDIALIATRNTLTPGRQSQFVVSVIWNRGEGWSDETELHHGVEIEAVRAVRRHATLMSLVFASDSLFDPHIGVIDFYSGEPTSPVILPLDWPAAPIAFADLNGDDTPELLTGEPHNLRVFAGSSVGWMPSGWIDFQRRLVSFVASDFDGDKDPDIVVLFASEFVRLENVEGRLKTERFEFSFNLDPPVATAAGDFDNDGRLDLAVVDGRGHHVRIIWDQGDGTVAPQWILTGYRPWRVVPGDFDSDGDFDLAVAHYTETGAAPRPAVLRVLWNVGERQWFPVTEYESPHPNTWLAGLASADFDADGHADLALSDNRQDEIVVLLSSGRSWFRRATRYPVAPGPRDVAVGDVTGDGSPDIVFSAPDVGLLVLTNKGRGEFVEAPRLTRRAGASPLGLTLGDFDRDGLADAVLCDSEGGGARLYRNAGRGEFVLAGHLLDGESLTYPALGDLDNDGAPELFVGSREQSAALLVQSAPGKWTALPAPGPLVSARHASFADIDADGRPDVILAVQTPHDLARGRGAVVGLLNRTPATNPKDQDGDGVLDDCEPQFVRGDVNHDGRFSVSDPVALLAYLFAGGIRPPCEGSADANDDGHLDGTDPLVLLRALFGGGGPLAPPFLDCGVDPTGDELTCESGCR